MFNFRSCCRLCLKQDESVAINCLDSDELCSAVKHFFCFDITSNDDCSTKVCRECTGKITNFLIFKNSVLHTQETIKQYQLFQAKILNIKDEPSDDDDVIFVSSKQVESFNIKIVQATARKSTTQLLPVVIKPIKLRKLRIICNSLTKNDLKNVVLNKRDQKILKLHTHTNMKSKQNNELKCPPIRLNLNKIFKKNSKDTRNSIKLDKYSPSTSDKIPTANVPPDLVNNNDSFINDNPIKDIKNQISSALRKILKDKELTDSTKSSNVSSSSDKNATISDPYTKSIKFANEKTTRLTKNRRLSALKQISKDKESTDSTKISNPCQSTSDENTTIWGPNAKSAKIIKDSESSKRIDNSDKTIRNIKNKKSSTLKQISKDKESTNSTKVSNVDQSTSDEIGTIMSLNPNNESSKTMDSTDMSTKHNKAKESSTVVSKHQTATDSTTPNESLNVTFIGSSNNKMPRPMIDTERTSVNANEETSKTKKPSSSIQFIPIKQGASLTPVSQPVSSVPLLTPIISQVVGSVQAIPNLLKPNGDKIHSQPLTHMSYCPNTSQIPPVFTNNQHIIKPSNVIPIRSNLSPISSQILKCVTEDKSPPNKSSLIQQPLHTTQMNYININPLNNNHSNSTDEFIPMDVLFARQNPINAVHLQNDHKVKVLSVKELNMRADVNNTRRPSNEPCPNLPIRISLVKLYEKIHIKLNNSSSAEIQYSNLTNDQKIAVKNSLMQDSARSRIASGLRESKFDKRSIDLLKWLGLTVEFFLN